MKLLILLVALLGSVNLIAKEPKSIKAIDSYVESVMETFHVPGAAIGIIKDGEVVHMRGYGIADIEKGHAVNENTIFKVASLTKAFTSAGLAILVDQEKMDWSDKVSTHLPDFKMYDDYATQEFSVIDILTHRSGLGLGAGDLMLWPEPTKFTRKQLVKNLRYLKPAYGFRERYAYDNTLYIVGGEIAAAVSGKEWEQYIRDSIFKPLGMNHCYTGGVDTEKEPNVVAPHLYMNGEIVVDQPNRIRPTSTLMAAAGGIKCSVHDLLTWMDVQLGLGTTTKGIQLFSEAQARKMWQSVTPLSVSKVAREMDNTHFRGYALGWRANDYRGEWMISHTGTLSGAMAKLTLLPDSNLGLVVLINTSSDYARSALTDGILQHFREDQSFDWLAYYKERRAKRQEWLASEEAQAQGMVLPDELAISNNRRTRKMLGTFRDPWFGKITLKREGDDVVFRSEMVPRMIGRVYGFAEDKNTWWVKWDNRSFEADSWLRFERKDGKLHLTMERIAEDSDWSMDVQDLNFIKVRR